MDIDVAIIGAGPAGCAAAIACSNAGLSTLIVTNKTETSIKTEAQPSESIHPGVASLLLQLHAAEIIELAKTGIYEGVQTGNRFSPLGSSPDSGAWYGTHINRAVFDSGLLEAAKLQGAGILYNEVVAGFIIESDWVTGITTASGKAITCKYVIDASGYKRVAGKKLAFKEQFFSPPLVAWTGLAAIADAADPLFQNLFTQFIPEPAGWTWLAPEPPNRCTWTRLAAKGKKEFLPPAQLEQFPAIGVVKVYNRRWGIFRPLCKEGIILCGDAAAIIDPAAGQGILNALLTGIEAAKTIVRCLHYPDNESVYLAEYDRWFFDLFTTRVEKLKTYYVESGIHLF